MCYNFQLADECAEAEVEDATSYEAIDSNQNCDTTHIEYCEKTDNITRRQNKSLQNGISSKSKVAGVQSETSIVKSKNTEPVKVST